MNQRTGRKIVSHPLECLMRWENGHHLFFVDEGVIRFGFADEQLGRWGYLRARRRAQEAGVFTDVVFVDVELAVGIFLERLDDGTRRVTPCHPPRTRET